MPKQTIIRKSLPICKLGSTGEKVSILSIGGHAIGKPTDLKIGVKIIRTRALHSLQVPILYLLFLGVIQVLFPLNV
jgi:hypothetical protein